MFFDHLPQRGVVCAHRGARSIAPENTLLALEYARKCGAHCWETDVRLSGDGKPLILHDEGLGRTTDIALRPQWHKESPWDVDGLSMASVRSLDAGSWFLTTDPYGTVQDGTVPLSEWGNIRGQKIPLLQEVLDYSRRYQFPVNLELKDKKEPSKSMDIVEVVLDMIQATDTMDLVLLSSSRYDYLRRARYLSQKISIAVITKGTNPQGLVEYLKSFSAVAYHPEDSLCDAALVDCLARAGIRVNCWTVNNTERAHALLAQGAGIISDWPQRFLPQP